MHMLNDAVNCKMVIHDSMLQDNTPVCIAFFTKQSPPSNSVYIRSLLVTSRAIQCQYYQYSIKEKDRMVHRYDGSKFVRLEFDKNVPTNTVIHFLTFGVYINGEFQFIGCSRSGIKKQHYYMFKGSVEDVQKVLAECGQFALIKSIPKWLKRIACCFLKPYPLKLLFQKGM